MSFVPTRSGYINPKASGGTLRQTAQKLKVSGAIQPKPKPVSKAQKNANTLGQVIRGVNRERLFAKKKVLAKKAAAKDQPIMKPM